MEPMARAFPATHTPRRAHASQAEVAPDGVMAPSVSDWLQTSARHQPLSEATVLELSRRVQRWQNHPGGPQAAPGWVQRQGLRARDHLVRHNLRLIGHTWGRHRSGFPAWEEGTADALQEAALSLMKAAERFDPARGYRFSTYANFWIRQGLWGYASRRRRMVRLPHDVADLLQRVQRLSREQEAATGQMPSVEWLAQRCGPRGSAMCARKLGALLRMEADTNLLELDRPCGSDGEETGLTLLDQVASAAPLEVERVNPAAEFTDLPDGEALYGSFLGDGQDGQRRQLPALLERLDPTARRLIWHRYLREHPLTPRQVKRVMGLEVEEQERVEREALQVLREGV
jgi:RNA polymerase sigma factor (sigma-70 family)